MKTIRRRILMGLVPSTAVALALTAAGIERTVSRNLFEGFDARLGALASMVGAGVEMEPDGRLEFHMDPAALHEFQGGERKGYFRVLDQAAKVVAASTAAPDMAFPAAGTAPVFHTVTAGLRRLRVCVRSVERAPEQEHEGDTSPGVLAGPPSVFQVEAGLPLDSLETMLAKFRAPLGLGFAALFAALVVLPTWLVARALRPLQALSAAAERIGPEAPDRRLGESDGAAEVQALVSALNRALDRIAEAYERQKRFTADAAHELRTPLSVIRAQCEVTLRKTPEAPELRSALENVERMTLRLSRLVEDLLTLSRFDARNVSLPEEPVDLARAAREAVRLHAVAVEAKGVKLTMDLPEPIPTRGAPGLLEECLSSLLENAVRYTPKGGSIHIEGGTSPSPWVSVRDTGPGFPEEEIPKIFGRFYRIDSARARSDGGLGLGLAIVSEIARLHRAQIFVQSHPGAGSRFELRMP